MCHPSINIISLPNNFPCVDFSTNYWRHKRERSMAPRFLNVSNICVECLDSLPSRISVFWRVPGTQWIGGWVGLGTGVAVLEKTGNSRSCRDLSHYTSYRSLSLVIIPTALSWLLYVVQRHFIELLRISKKVRMELFVAAS